MNFMNKTVLICVNPCLKIAWLRTKSKQMEILKRRDRQCLSGDSIFQMSRLYHGRQATSVTSVSSVAIYDICRESSTNPPFFAKRTQSCPPWRIPSLFVASTYLKSTILSKAKNKPNSKPILPVTMPLSGNRLGNLGNYYHPGRNRPGIFATYVSVISGR
jgi:hypothetical protein